jgi:predicted tellurium resistance membrane protein TerC
MDWLTEPEAWIGLLTLTLMEVVLGIDNIVFISVLAGRLERAQQARARLTGLSLAMLMRIGLLLSLAWIMRLTTPLFNVGGITLTGHALILVGGGLFLFAKSTREIHHAFDEHGKTAIAKPTPSFASVIIQILLLDLVFSLDSVITAVGMVDEIPVMIVAIVLAVIIMMVFAGGVSRFIDRHPTVKMLALSFLLLIGVNLVAEGVGFHIPKGYTYFAMAFSLGVEMLNLRLRRKAK